ncbi:DUF397 domain-containing protein [Streptomyces griseoviridis]|uniref:DUF397 domain-containing protein n=1 Tax=Streptomyces griseoviridis TaxID=45398 RepID=A0A3Q9KWG5_STRGD|nr:MULTISPECIES: DUF397 domain-containing protein [Streptomyces]AZS87455.1 DUF397 domain-containing protein [Streptomyces griseoviridis]MDH6701728.1 hypothetical protein [Streptomyces sp. MAA16]QCN85698.1 DUF397 domain-containing protein [Streptomyces griseoviridis]
MTTESPRWFTSSYSDNGGNCVEIAANLAARQGIIPVRDSKVPTSPVLTFQTNVFTTFLTSLKDTP